MTVDCRGYRCCWGISKNSSTSLSGRLGLVASSPAAAEVEKTGTATNMTRRYGRCASDQRLVAAVPHGHWRTTTFVAGLRQTGIVAPLVLDGPMTGAAFRAYVEQFLALRSRSEPD